MFIKKEISNVFSRKNIKWKLTRLVIELTQRCNNNCIHCLINLPADDFTSKQNELRTEEIKEIIQEAASLGCISIRFTGGEPLLRDDFKNIYLFTKKLGARVSIFTNATLINESMCNLWRRFSPLAPIEVSIYGMKRHSYESVTRNPGSFYAAQNGIKLLVENKIPFLIKSAVLPQNKSDLKDLNTWVSSIPATSKYPSYAMFFDLRCRRDSLEKNILIKKNRISPKEGLKILDGNTMSYTRGLRTSCQKKKFYIHGSKLFSCNAGLKGGFIDAYGKMYICALLRDPSTAYCLNSGSLDDALRNHFFQIRQFQAKNEKYLSRCANCFIKIICTQCPGKSWAETGVLDEPVEYLCKIAHLKATYLGLLKNKEKSWQINDWEKRVAIFKESQQ